MMIVEILTRCLRQPIRFSCAPGRVLPDSIDIMICDDDAPANSPRYILEIPCREAHINAVANLHSLHDCTDTESGGISLAENWDTFCVNRERCVLRSLTLQKLFSPMLIDELAADQLGIKSHRND